MDFEDIPEAEESPVVEQQQQEEPFYYEENPMTEMPAPEVVENEPYYYEEPSAQNVTAAMQTMQMPPPAPEEDAWMMPEPEPEDALT